MRALDLQPLPHQIEREHPRFCQHACYDSRRGVAGAEGEVPDLADDGPQRLVCCEEETHVRNDLSHGGGAATEEPARTFVLGDVEYGATQGRVDALVTLRGEACAEQVQRVCRCGGDTASYGAGDEGFGP